VNDAFQIFDGHNRIKIPLPAELSPANMTVGRAPAVLRREPERVRWQWWPSAKTGGQRTNAPYRLVW
jgi:hypothetical protein